MKNRRPFVVALTLALGVVGVPTTAVATPANTGVDATADDTMVSALIVERLPGRTSLAAQALVEDLTDLDAMRGRQLGDRFETIVLDEPITTAEAEQLARSLETDG